LTNIGNGAIGRDEEYLRIVIGYAESLAIGGQIIKLFPTILKPYVFPNIAKRELEYIEGLKVDQKHDACRFAARYLTYAVTNRIKAENYVTPIIQERVTCANRFGSKWVDKPVCCLFSREGREGLANDSCGGGEYV
jgi:hypothetical protein